MVINKVIWFVGAVITGASLLIGAPFSLSIFAGVAAVGAHALISSLSSNGNQWRFNRSFFHNDSVRPIYDLGSNTTHVYHHTHTPVVMAPLQNTQGGDELVNRNIHLHSSAPTSHRQSEELVNRQFRRTAQRAPIVFSQPPSPPRNNQGFLQSLFNTRRHTPSVAAAARVNSSVTLDNRQGTDQLAQSTIRLHTNDTHASVQRGATLTSSSFRPNTAQNAGHTKVSTTFKPN